MSEHTRHTSSSTIAGSDFVGTLSQPETYPGANNMNQEPLLSRELNIAIQGAEASSTSLLHV